MSTFLDELVLSEQGPITAPASGALALYVNNGNLFVKGTSFDVNLTSPPAPAIPSNMVTTDTAQTISGVKTFTNAPGVPDAAFDIAKINGLSAALSSKYSATNPPPVQPAPSNMMTLDTAQTITGGKDFTGTITKSGVNLATTADIIPLSSTAPVGITSSTGTVGTGTTAARHDHRHGFATANPVALATTLSQGSASSIARSDHVHPTTGLGTLSGNNAWTGSQTWGSGTVQQFNGAVYANSNLHLTSPDGFMKYIYLNPVASADATNIARNSMSISFITQYWNGTASTAESIVFQGVRGASATAGDHWVEATGGFRATSLYDNGNRVLTTASTIPAPSNMVTTDTAQTISGTKTFSVAPLVPDSSWTIAKTTGLQTALDSKYSRANDWNYRNKAALRRWSEALGNTHSAPADLYFMGDSNSEGYHASSANTRFLSLVRDRLQAAYNPVGVPGGEGFVNPHVSGMGTAIDRWVHSTGVTLSGPGVQDQWGFGLGGRYAWHSAAGHQSTLTFYGNQIHVFYTSATGTGTMGISIDGGAVQTLSTTSASGTTSGKIWSSPALTRGSHTITVSWSAGGPVVLDGALVSDGDSIVGVRTWDASHSGYTAAMMAGTPNNWPQYFPGGVGPELVVLNFGANEIAQGTTPAAFETNMLALVDKIRANSATTSIAIMMLPRRVYNTTTDADWQALTDAAERVALARGTAWFDFTQEWPISTASATVGATPGASGGSGAMYYDQVHLSDAGHKALADRILKAIAPAASIQKTPVTVDRNQTIGGIKQFSNSVYFQAGLTADGGIGTSQTMWADGGFFENGQRVYSPNNPPPAAAASAPANMVTTDTTQTISGAKNFTGGITSGGTALVLTTDARLSDARTPTAHTHPAAQISDSSTVGRSVLTAADAAAARTAIGAGTSSFSGAYSALTGTPTTFATTSGLIGDSTAVGRSVLTAVDAAAARTAIGAGTSNFSGAYSALTGTPTNLATVDTVQTFTALKTFSGEIDVAAQTAVPTAPAAGYVSLYSTTDQNGIARLRLMTSDGQVSSIRGIEPYIMSVTGVLTVQAGKSRVYLEDNYVVESIRASVNTAPAGGPVTVDVNLNGTTIFTTQANRPTIVAGANTGLATLGAGTITTISTGQYLTVDVDTVGTTTAGETLTVVIRLRRV